VPHHEDSEKGKWRIVSTCFHATFCIEILGSASPAMREQVQVSNHLPMLEISLLRLARNNHPTAVGAYCELLREVNEAYVDRSSDGNQVLSMATKAPQKKILPAFSAT